MNEDQTLQHELNTYSTVNEQVGEYTKSINIYANTAVSSGCMFSDSKRAIQGHASYSLSVCEERYSKVYKASALTNDGRLLRKSLKLRNRICGLPVLPFLLTRPRHLQHRRHRQMHPSVLSHHPLLPSPCHTSKKPP